MSDADPLWYRDAIVYELRVGAFQDSDGDGIGDFRGLTQRLDYLKDLGVTALWLLPFYPSPMLDDGYDIADYEGVHPDYGTLDDFRTFLREAHARGLKVITELVLNHTSDQHPWFQRARRAPAGSRWRDFYVWSDTPERYKGARIIFKDFERSNWTWDPVAKAYYWHRFFPPARSQLRPSAGAARHAAGPRLLARPRRRRAAARRRALPRRARGDELREPSRDAPGAEGDPAARRPDLRAPHAPRRGEPVARGRRRVFRQRRRVPHGVPLPADAAPLHGALHGGPLPDHRHPGADAADPRHLPVGALPPQPRRAHAR